MAWHWRQLGVPFRLLTRSGPTTPRVPRRSSTGTGSRPRPRDRRRRAVRDHRHRHPARRPAPHGPLRRGRLGDYRLDAATRSPAWPGRVRLHVVLVEGAIARARAPGAAGVLRATWRSSVDVLGFRHYTSTGSRHAADGRPRLRRLAGRPGRPDGRRSARVARDLGRAAGRDVRGRGRARRSTAIGRAGTASSRSCRCRSAARRVGCGDAFIAVVAGRPRRRPGGDLVAAVERGKVGGAAATAWPRPLPDDAYERLPSALCPSAAPPPPRPGDPLSG